MIGLTVEMTVWYGFGAAAAKCFHRRQDKALTRERRPLRTRPVQQSSHDHSHPVASNFDNLGAGSASLGECMFHKHSGLRPTTSLPEQRCRVMKYCWNVLFAALQAPRELHCLMRGRDGQDEGMPTPTSRGIDALNSNMAYGQSHLQRPAGAVVDQLSSPLWSLFEGFGAGDISFGVVREGSRRQV